MLAPQTTGDALTRPRFPPPQIKIMYLVDAEQLMKLSPQELRDKGFGCMCICRPRETDLLLKHMGARWRQVGRGRGSGKP